MIHYYELVADVDGIRHFRCPTCSKETAIGNGQARILTNHDGQLLDGDVTATHRFERGLTLNTPEVLL